MSRIRDLDNWTVEAHPEGGMAAISPYGLTVRVENRAQLIAARRQAYSEELIAMREALETFFDGGHRLY